MPISRPGFIWSGTEWVPIGSPISPVTYQPAAPSTPSTGDIWIDSDGTPYTLNGNDFVLKSEAEQYYLHPFVTMGA